MACDTKSVKLTSTDWGIEDLQAAYYGNSNHHEHTCTVYVQFKADELRDWLDEQGGCFCANFGTFESDECSQFVTWSMGISLDAGGWYADPWSVMVWSELSDDIHFYLAPEFGQKIEWIDRSPKGKRVYGELRRWVVSLFSVDDVRSHNSG